MKIPLVNLQRQHEELFDAMHEAIDRVIDTGDFTLGSHVDSFEESFAAYTETRHCVGVGSGLDALALAMKGLGIGPGDEVITAANAFIGTALAIRQTGAMPVLVDHDAETFTLDPHRLSTAITPRTKAIIPVHQYGHPAEMNAILSIAEEHNLLVIEDATQAHGARYRGRRCGSLGHAAAFGFEPTANLGALGDGGAVTTNDASLAQWVRAARNYGAVSGRGHHVRGVCSRLDSIHAAVLRVKLRYLDEWNDMRRWLAAQYGKLLADADLILPAEREGVEPVYHRFVVRTPRRDELIAALRKQGIESAVHYATPIHRHVAFGRGCMPVGPLTHTETTCDEIVSLPMCPFLSLDGVEAVAHTVAARLAERVSFQLQPAT